MRAQQAANKTKPAADFEVEICMAANRPSEEVMAARAETIQAEAR
jgi:hypothetical protein